MTEDVNGVRVPMSWKRGRQQGKAINPEEISIEDRLQFLGANDLRCLVKYLTDESPQGHRLTLEWLRTHSSSTEESGTPSDLDNKLLFEYWENAESIISEFNQYGGGSEDAEEEARDWLGRIVQLAEEGHISTEAKLKFMDEAFVQYNIGNSGFEDELAEALKEDFPDQIIEYHWNIACRSIRGGNRKTYRTAAEHLKKAKHIYLAGLKDEPRWKQRFAELKAEFRRSFAFLEEVKNL